MTLVLASPGIHSLAAHANFSKDRKDCVVSNAPTQKLVAPNIAEVRDTTVISCPTTTAAGPAVDGRPRQGSRSGYAPTYGGAHGWQCQGGSWTFRDRCSYGGAAPVACAQTRVTGPLVSAAGGPPDPAPMIREQAASLQKQVNAGTMRTSPSDPARHFAFLPSCFWLDGTRPSQTFELQVQDPTRDTASGTPDGRAITYVYRINVGLQSVHWDFGDGSSRDGSAGTPWNAASPDSCSNDHTYERISATGRPGATTCPAGYPHTAADDGCYRVQATETYAVSVTAYWFDGAAPHAPVDLGSMAPLVISPPPTYLRVQQIQGVPVTRRPA